MRILSGFLRVFFRLLYHPFAWTYDFVAAVVSLGQWNAWVMSVTPYLTGPCVLEVGHGPGHLLEWLVKNERKSFGLDESRQMGWLARKRLQRRGFSPVIVCGHAQVLPFPANTFQQVVATFPSEYIADPRTLSEIHRVLTPGGEGVILLLAWITDKHWYGRIAAWLFRDTGQTPVQWEKQTLETFQSQGFDSWTEHIPLKMSRVLVLHMKKLETI